MSTQPAYMALYPADYLGDTVHLTCEEHGAYMLLLMYLWQRGGRVPDDDARLARVVRLDGHRWLSMKEVLRHLLTIEDGHVTQKRLYAELEKARALSDIRRDAVNKRWSKNKDVKNT